MTQDQSDVNFLSIYRFPSLDSYKTVLKLAKHEAERAFRLKLVNTSFKPNKLQLLGVLAHLNLTGAQGILGGHDSVTTINDDLRSMSNSSIMK